MINNYLRIAWRGIKKDKLFTSIKIGGLAMGIAACLLIALFIEDELSYDTHYENKNNIFRLVLELDIDGETKKSTHFPLPFAETLVADFPEIKKAGKIYGSGLASGGKRAFRLTDESQNNFEQGFLYGDQGIFEILEIPLKEGNYEDALNPGSIVISESKAAKYFPNGNALGQSLILDDNPSEPYTITGIMNDFPTNSHLNFDFLMPIRDTNMRWSSQNYFTYVLLDEKSDLGALQEKMYSIMENYVIPAQIERGRDAGFIDVLKTIEYKLQPITDIHLKSDIEMADGLKHGDIRFIWLFAAIAGFILLLAASNFINLATAKSAKRAKEVGLRKTVGAFKRNLVAQFLTESVLFSFISLILGVVLAWLLLPMFNAMAAKSIVLPITSSWFLPVLLVSTLLIGLIAGLYPAFYLSAFNPVNVLKGNVKIGGKSGGLRSGLVVFQFTTSIILIIGTLIIYKQMDFILKKELGYDKEQLILVEGGNVLGDKSEAFKEQLLQLPQVQQVSLSDYVPVDGSRRNQTTFNKVGVGSEDTGVLSQTWRVDYDYIKTLGMHIEEGRDFSKEFSTDSENAVIINRKMAHDLQLQNPLGKQLDNHNKKWTIVGVVEDFHFESLKKEISPLALVIGSDINTIMIKLNSGNANEALASISDIWDRNVPNQAINYSFLDQKFAQMHEDVQRIGKIFNSFALFAILVASLGLFALSAFMVEQRNKEVSIRIVLGAPFRSIYKLLTWDFLKLIFISILIAIPIGGYMMHRWLEDFAFRITIGWEIFLTAGTIAFLIAMLTISYQSIAAALVKPIHGLRTE
ncbi:MAG: hypothetical protein COA50_00445 [Flavobacteriaceae bacterium]|nr:MAG: hypothetical protein COA50_00445 [Flavobacteriaceae bacterium]